MDFQLSYLGGLSYLDVGHSHRVCARVCARAATRQNRTIAMADSGEAPLADREIVRELAREGVVIDRIDVVARLKNGAVLRCRCRHVKGITLGELLEAAEELR